MATSNRSILTTAALITASAGAASAQWTAISLHPVPPTAESGAYDQAAGQQVGQTAGKACLWTGTAASYVDLHPSAAFGSSQALGTSGSVQVGWADLVVHSAALWTGTAGSFVDLTPAGAQIAEAWGAHGDIATGEQVGYAQFAGSKHAVLWKGTAASFLDLHAPAWIESAARDTDGTQQVGWADVGTGAPRAALWTGMPASAIILNPTGSAPTSECYAVAGGQQVGWANVGGVTVSASLWTGTAASWVNLNPAGATKSIALDVDAGEQVGYAQIAGVYRAGLWKGTAASWTDLHASVPFTATESYAWGIEHDGTKTYITGYAKRGAPTFNFEAILWTLDTAPPCYADCDADAALSIDDFICFQTLFALSDPSADCDEDGALSIDDFICFQTYFAIGC